MTDPLSTWNDGPVEGRRPRLRREGGRGAARRGTGRGLRQRRHAVVREADADPARLLPAPPGGDGRGRPRRCATGTRGRRPANGTTGGWPGCWRTTTPATTPTCPVLAGGLLAAYANITVDQFDDGGRRLPAQRPSSHAGPRLPRVRLRAHGRAARPPPGATGSRTTSPPAAAATSCGPISDEVYGIPREGVIGSAVALAYTPDEHGRGDHPPGSARLPRRRAGEAGAHLDPDRAPAGAGGRQLQRRHRDARLHPAPGHGRRCDSCCCTTTPSGSSTTSPAPSGRSTGPRPRAGRSSASRTTGPRVF